MGADGAGQRQLTSVGAGGHFLRWTADGTAIIFRAESGGQIRTMRVSVADGALTQLPDVASGAHMSLSPSQDVIMDVRGHKTLWAYPLDGRPAARGVRVLRPRRPHRLSDLVTRRALGAVRPSRSTRR